MGSNPILSTIFNIESAPGNNRFLSCSSSFLYADVRKAENAALSLVRIPHCHGQFPPLFDRTGRGYYTDAHK